MCLEKILTITCEREFVLISSLKFACTRMDFIPNEGPWFFKYMLNFEYSRSMHCSRFSASCRFPDTGVGGDDLVLRIGRR